jgi:hypothetical protein
MFNLNVVQPTRLDPESTFKFRCHHGVSCFTQCCSNISIMLTPYDVLRMKKRLGITSQEFLEKYTITRVDDKSSHPYAYLAMTETEDRTCPFLGTKEVGCTIYEDRPVTCRYYPVGQATMKTAAESADNPPVHEEFYFFVREEHCKGYDEPNQWTVNSWREDQGAEHFDAMNREWKHLLMRRELPGQPKLDEKKKIQFYMASYDLDNFRSFIFESKFLDIFDIDAETVEAMRSDDVALMKFAFTYIKYVMMMEQSLKLKDGLDPATLRAERSASRAGQEG